MQSPSTTKAQEEENEEEDILAPALSLEQTYYSQGLALGHTDGTKAGLAQGRRFGLENGFDKFLAMGRLHGRSIVWNSRLLDTRSNAVGASDVKACGISATTSGGERESERVILPQVFAPSGRAVGAQRDSSVGYDDDVRPLKNAAAVVGLPGLPLVVGSQSRLQKHVTTLYALTELESLLIENTEEAVSDYDDRYRRAVAKADIIGKIVKERVVGIDGPMHREVGSEEKDNGQGEGEMEDIAWKGNVKGREGIVNKADEVSKLKIEVE